MLNIIKANGVSEIKFLEKLKQRAQTAGLDVSLDVSKIIENVRQNKDKALFEYTKKFDKVELSSFAVSKEEIQKAYERTYKKLIEVIELAAENIRFFHNAQKSEGFLLTKENGIVMGQKVRGLEKVGVYVPGGTAAYPSSVLMNIIPAKVAGVREIIMVTPPSKDGFVNDIILAAAFISGADRVFKIGGAQAIAALALGTESIPKVDKVTGPGNAYVAAAKRMLYGVVDIDSIAGPSEILIIADKNANPKYVAADMLSQAEHDKLASAVVLTDSESLCEEINRELIQLTKLETRRELIESSIENFGGAIICEDIKAALNLANSFAPEHLELLIENPFEMLGEVLNAGSVFLGEYTPEAVGDYFAGPNHILPTDGTAKFFSPLGYDSFVKRFNFLYYSKAALEKWGEKITIFAESEGLSAHANSVKVRLKNLKEW